MSRKMTFALLGLAAFGPVGCAVGADPSTIELLWDKTAQSEGTTFDRTAGTLIVGGSVTGPSTKGGSAQWRIPEQKGRVEGIEVTIYTRGGTSTTWGKGIHARRSGGQVELFVNDALVHTIVCDQIGEYDDYWPKTAPVSSRYYRSGKIHLSINAPPEKFTIKVSPNTVIDLHKVALAMSLE